MNRREFLGTGGKAALGVGLGALAAEALAAPAGPAARKVSSNEKITVGAIGVGGMGSTDVRNFLNHPEVQIAALCDVDSKHLAAMASEVEKKQGHAPRTFNDFRRVLDMKDVDAVIIATPDHWHALPFILACEAGKDVFCEKPISHDIIEAQSMLGAAQHFKRVVQVDTWQRSMGQFRDAVKFVESGKMGKITVCRAWIVGKHCLGHVAPSAPPAELDWDFWLGPAPKAPYQSDRCPFNWRYFMDYGEGQTGDMGPHMIDIVLLAMNTWHPQEVAAMGGKLFCGPNDDATAPDTLIATYRFPDFVMQWEVRSVGNGLDGEPNTGAEFIGENGQLIASREGLSWTPFGNTAGPVNRSPDLDHIQNFLDCVKSRSKPRSDIESSYCTTIACHLADLAWETGRVIKWDGKKGRVIGDDKAMDARVFRYQYRHPWKLPAYPFTMSI